MKDWIRELCPEIADWQAELIDSTVNARMVKAQAAVQLEERERCVQLVRHYIPGGHPCDSLALHLIAAIERR